MSALELTLQADGLPKVKEVHSILGPIYGCLACTNPFQWQDWHSLAKEP